MPHRHEDWLAQARRDLKVARDSLADRNYEWCSFQCQQSAEKALKALLRFHKNEMRGHDLPKLIKAVMAVVEMPEMVVAAGKDLNAQYFSPRYPDSVTEGHQRNSTMKKLQKNASGTPRRSLHSSKRTYREYPDWGLVNQFVSRVRRRQPLLVLLFGSVARGDFWPDSDADVLLVFEKPVDRKAVYADVEGAVEPLVKTVEEMERFIREGEPFYIEMIEDGILLYDANGEYKKLSRLVEDAKVAWGLKRTPDGWQWTNDQPVWPTAG